jgi:transcriptional regulator with XRE-family HTH domain
VGKPQPEVDPFRDELNQLRKDLGERIRALRKSKGWSQEQFSDYAHIHRTFAGALERGEKNVSFHGLALIARCFGITLSELLAGLEAGQAIRVRKSSADHDPLDRNRILQEAATLERTARSLKDIALGKEQHKTPARRKMPK